MIELYNAPMPEGWKVSIAFEELGIPYVVHALKSCHDNTLLPDFLHTSPSGCVPAIIDHDVEGACTVFDATAILV